MNTKTGNFTTTYHSKYCNKKPIPWHKDIIILVSCLLLNDYRNMLIQFINLYNHDAIFFHEIDSKESYCCIFIYLYARNSMAFKNGSTRRKKSLLYDLKKLGRSARFVSDNQESLSK